MWILPQSLHYLCAPEPVVWKEDLTELSDIAVSSLMWKSKPLLSPIWSRKWRRVYWIRHLFGRILKPSHSIRFEAAWIASLPVIPVSPSAIPENGGGLLTQGIFGPLLIAGLTSYGQDVVGLKTCRGTLPWDSTKFVPIFADWVIGLKQEYLQRRKSGLPTCGNAYLSWLWTTPVLNDSDRSGSAWPTPLVSRGTRHISHGKPVDSLRGAVLNWPTPTVPNGGRSMASNTVLIPGKTSYKKTGRKMQVDLANAVKLWPTPTVSMSTGAGSNGLEGGLNLQTAVKAWPTPTTRDYKNGQLNERDQKHSPPLNTMALWYIPKVQDSRISGYGPGNRKFKDLHPQVIGQQDQANDNMNGKNPVQLNPAWVAQLMGTTLKRTFYVCTVTVSSPIKLLSRSTLF